jgi:hypothetical protein
MKQLKSDWEAAVLPLNYARLSPDLAETARSAKRLGGGWRPPPALNPTRTFRVRQPFPVL